MCLILIPQYICQPTRRPADGRLKSHTKNVLFREKNAVGRATFVGQLTVSAGPSTHV